MNNDQKGQRDLTEDVKIMPDDVNFVKPGKANQYITNTEEITYKLNISPAS